MVLADRSFVMMRNRVVGICGSAAFALLSALCVFGLPDVGSRIFYFCLLVASMAMLVRSAVAYVVIFRYECEPTLEVRSTFRTRRFPLSQVADLGPLGGTVVLRFREVLSVTSMDGRVTAFRDINQRVGSPGGVVTESVAEFERYRAQPS